MVRLPTTIPSCVDLLPMGTSFVLFAAGREAILHVTSPVVVT
jgi:hypothetical protein